MSEQESNSSEISLTEEEKSLIAQAFSLNRVEIHDGFLVFVAPDIGSRRRENGIPVEAARAILEAINRGAERLEDYEGWIDPSSGFVEFEVKQQGLNWFVKYSAEYEFEVRPCSHTHRADPPVEMSQELNHISPMIRVTSKDSSTCIEISRNTPLCTPITPIEHFDRKTGQARRSGQDTLKVFLPGPTRKEDLKKDAQQLADTFLFELNARHRLPYKLRQRMPHLPYLPNLPKPSRSIRYPKTAVSENIATLFSIPSDFDMRGNRTLAYLSYYQIIESFLPAIHQRATVAAVRRMIRSLDFDETKDSSIMKILNSVGRAHGASDGDQLKRAVEECVSGEKLHEFFSLNSIHFGKTGPISGVPAINARSGESIQSQTAKRVYALRNRIVHAKDDVRFAESKVLLPLSHEASKLQPDVELVRLLAIDVIVDNP
ncbi:hypothetical protein [Streptomyces microflavus]|uniref:hypothetical protein n=1 Tax=Streptomyces microflavus TaxID=1919 RepID=UPI0036B2BCB8